MELICLPNRQRTHVVADRRRCLVFDSANFSHAAGELARHFSITPANLHDLANNWTTKRPDLLIGAFHPDQATLTTMGDGVALDPRTSQTVKAAAKLIGVKHIRRMMVANGPYDVWTTPRQLMRGAIPDILFHGTSDQFLEGILAHGLRTDQPPNWALGGRHQVFLTATPQTAAFHARRTAARQGGSPVVLSCRRPLHLSVDWDVQHQVVDNPLVPDTHAWRLTQEAGLFASRNRIRRCAILAVHIPGVSVPFHLWKALYRAPLFSRAQSWVVRW